MTHPNVRFTVWVVVALAAALGVCGILFVREAGLVEQRLREREMGRTGSLAQLFRSELRPAANDLRALVSGEGLSAFLTSGSPADRERATRRAVFFSQQQRGYDQIRFLDESGQEVIRVDQGGRVVPADQLQNEADRPFFKKTQTLAPGQLFISAYELNVENGRIQEPHKPVLHFAVPVFDGSDRRRGVYVITYRGDALISRLQQAAPIFSHRLRLLNGNGYWIRGAAPEDEWGFLLNGRTDRTLARTDPALWAQILREPVGQARSRNGFFTWHRIDPRDFAGSDATTAVADDDFILVGSEVNAQEWSATFSNVRELFLIITPCLIGLVASSVWFFRTRQRALSALRRSEENLAVTVESIGDAVLATDRAGNITRMNRVAERLTGWSQTEWVGRPIAEIFRIIDESTGALAVIPVEEVLATGETRGLSGRCVLIARDGVERPIADSAAPIRDRSNHIVGVVLVFRDVTAERASEMKLANALDELARERKRLQRVFDSVPIGICFGVTRPDGMYTRLINDAHLSICGITRAQANERDIFVRLTHPEDREYQKPFTAQLEAGLINHHTMDKRYIRPDGRVVWVMLAYQREKYSDGSYDDLSIVVDITERKQVEQQINRQNARLRALFESLPGLYLVLKPNLEIVTATDAYLQAVMTTREAIIGRALFDVFPDNPDDPAATGVANLKSSVERVRQSLKPDTMAIQKYDVRRADGTFEERFWSPTNSPMVGMDGELEYIIHRVEDVTEFVRHKPRKATEGEGALLTRMEQMEAEVFQSSQKVQVANAQLRSAIAELESFSYSVSHDLRAPLRHINGYVEMLAREAGEHLSEKGRRYLKTIADVSFEMGQLIENLLEFSRMGRVEMREGTVDLDTLIRETQLEFEPLMQNRNIVWKIAPLPAIRGDMAMLKQVFLNLLGNALKYSRARDPAEIEIGSAGREEDGRLVVFVRDNGAGFDMKYAGKLFGVFQRLHHAGEFEGNGIGLASVQRIITRHGGRVWGIGERDVGATFFVTLKPVSASHTT